jgi:hypothetical protein
MTKQKIKHVMTFTGYLPDDAMKQAQVLGNADVHACRDALSEALKKAGVEHVVVSKIHREKPKESVTGSAPPSEAPPMAQVAPIQEPDPTPVAEVPHGKRAAA